MIHSVDRRSFLFGASVAGFGILASGRHGWAGGVGPNEVLNFACIGVGGKGSSDTDHAGHYGEIVASATSTTSGRRQLAEKFPRTPRRTPTTASCSMKWASKIDAVVGLHARSHHAPAAVTRHAAWASTSIARSR